MLHIACVLDRFSYDCFTADIPMQPLTLSENLEVLPDVLFVESAWHSIEGKVRVQWEQGSWASKKIPQWIETCRKHSVPTVFWNKEDPAHFSDLLHVAKHFDIICTTDQNCIEEYKQSVGHDRVYLLQFAAQPKLHFAKPDIVRKKRPFFAGQHYGDKYPERKKNMNIILEPALQHGLEIYDRGSNHFDQPYKQSFPPKYNNAIFKAVSYQALCNLYSEYSVLLNVDSIVQSPTMFSRRVFEALASGTPIISAYSQGIEHCLGNTVHISRSKTQTTEFLRLLLENSDYWAMSSLCGQRKVLAAHTYAHRWKQIFEICNLNVPSHIHDAISQYEQAALATTQDELTSTLCGSTTQHRVPTLQSTSC